MTHHSSLHSSPQEAMQAPPEEFLYVACLHEGTGVDAPDFIAVVDAEDGSIIHETPMPNVGDELHHFGYSRDQERLVVPGLFSNRIQVFDIGRDRKTMALRAVDDQLAARAATSCRTASWTWTGSSSSP